jgi:hypothetical protein
MARPTKPAVSPEDTTEQATPPVPQPEPEDTTEQATPPVPQPEPEDTTEQATPPVPQPEPEDTTEQATPPAPEPGTIVEPDHEVEIPTVEPAEVGAEPAPVQHADSATAAATEDRPEPARSAPLSETSEPSSSVATVGLPLLRRYRAPVVGAVVLGAVIGIVRRLRR